MTDRPVTGPEDEPLVTDSPPPGLMEAFLAYEAALMADDTSVLDSFFAPGPHTLRGDDGGLLVGHRAISAFRASRGGVPSRTIVDTHVRTTGPRHALIVSVSRYRDGREGLHTQAWARFAAGWKIIAAHVTPARQPVRPNAAGAPPA